MSHAQIWIMCDNEFNINMIDISMAPHIFTMMFCSY